MDSEQINQEAIFAMAEEIDRLRGLCDLQAMAIRQLDRGRQVPKDIRAAIEALRGEEEE